jgi:hypothetical protein
MLWYKQYFGTGKIVEEWLKNERWMDQKQVSEGKG